MNTGTGGGGARAPPPSPASPSNQPNAAYQPSFENVEKAQKCAKFAVSALQFDDIPYAIENLREALKLLTDQ